MVILYFVDDYSDNLPKFKFLLIFVAIALLFFGSIEFIKQEYYKSWKKNKILLKSPFKEFIDIGFLKQENYLKGQLRGYSIIVGVEWLFYQSRPEYYFKVLFNPYLNDRLLKQDECTNYNDELGEKKSQFTLNSIVKFYGQRKLFLRTEHEDIILDINKSIDFIKMKKLDPMGFKDWINCIPILEKHIEKFVYE